METTNLDNELILLDDYKIYVQHELIKINNKIETIINKKNDKLEPNLPKNLNKIKSEFYNKIKVIDLICKTQKENQVQVEINFINLKNKTQNDNVMTVKYIHTACVLTLTISIIFSINLILFF